MTPRIFKKQQIGTTQVEGRLGHPNNSISKPYYTNLKSSEGNQDQLIITTDNRLNQTKPPERGDWVCFVPHRAWKTASKNILSRAQNQDNWLIGYITEITDVTNRECNITIQGHTDTTTLSMILGPGNTIWT